MGSTILQPLIAKLLARSVLSDRDVAALLKMPHMIRRFTPSEFIVRQRKPATHTCILLTGFAYRQKIVSSGARQIVGLQVPGDPIDLHNSMLAISDHSVQGLTDGVIAQVARKDILALAAAYPNIAHAFWIDTLVGACTASSPRRTKAGCCNRRRSGREIRCGPERQARCSPSADCGRCLYNNR